MRPYTTILNGWHQNTDNFINLSYTLAVRHQLLQCHKHQSPSLLENEIEIGPGNIYNHLCAFLSWDVVTPQ